MYGATVGSRQFGTRIGQKEKAHKNNGARPGPQTVEAMQKVPCTLIKCLHMDPRGPDPRPAKASHPDLFDSKGPLSLKHDLQHRIPARKQPPQGCHSVTFKLSRIFLDSRKSKSLTDLQYKYKIQPLIHPPPRGKTTIKAHHCNLTWVHHCYICRCVSRFVAQQVYLRL